MASWPQASADGQRVLVPTHCVYPSNGSVVVTIECGKGTYLVHDDRGACDEVESAGASLPRIDRLMRHIVSPQGLEIDESGLIRSKLIPESDLLATIILVANVSKEVAHELLWIFRPRTKQNFRNELEALLELKFPTSLSRDVHIVGATNKPHRFHHMVRLSHDRKLLIDAATHEPSSINSIVVSHLDVRNVNDQKIEQRIIYNDQERWSAADLNLLSIGARTVPFSRAGEVLERLAA